MTALKLEEAEAILERQRVKRERFVEAHGESSPSWDESVAGWEAKVAELRGEPAPAEEPKAKQERSSNGSGAPRARKAKASKPDASAIVPSLDEIKALREQLGRKFEPSDVTEPLRAAAVSWLLGTKHDRSSWALDVALKVASSGKISDGQAKGVLNVMTAQRGNGSSAPAAEPKAELSEGMYRKGGEVYRVKRSRQTGGLYAMRLIDNGDRGEFEYEKGAIRLLAAEDRMTLEQAQEHGVQHGWCCVCGAHLTDPKSIARGIGPVCAGKV